jgi:hypothetical protein
VDRRQTKKPTREVEEKGDVEQVGDKTTSERKENEAVWLAPR